MRWRSAQAFTVVACYRIECAVPSEGFSSLAIRFLAPCLRHNESGRAFMHDPTMLFTF